MAKKRTDRLNSLLREVISDVIKKEVHDPRVHPLITITRVEITKDLHYAKVYFSVIGGEKEKKETETALQSAAGYIGCQSSKQIVIRYFPELRFLLDEGVERHMRVETLLEEIDNEQQLRSQEKSE